MHFLKPQKRSLHDSIFGPSPYPKESKKATLHSPKNNQIKRLLRTVFSPIKSSSSTESLPTSSTSSMDGNFLYGRKSLLNLCDRRKSVSAEQLNLYIDKNEDGQSNNGMFFGLRKKRTSGIIGGSISSSLLLVPQVILISHIITITTKLNHMQAKIVPFTYKFANV